MAHSQFRFCFVIKKFMAYVQPIDVKPESTVSCESLPPSWNDIMANTQFPLPPGVGVSLTCSPGHTLTGDNTVTCVKGTEFSFNNAPSCLQGLLESRQKVVQRCKSFIISLKHQM